MERFGIDTAQILIICILFVVFNFLFVLGLIVTKPHRLLLKAASFLLVYILTGIIHANVAEESGEIVAFAGITVVLVSLAQADLFLAVKRQPFSPFKYLFITIAALGVYLVLNILECGFVYLCIPIVVAVISPNLEVLYRYLGKWQKLDQVSKFYLLAAIVRTLHLMDYPFLRMNPDFKSYGFVVAFIIEVMTWVPLIILMVREINEEDFNYFKMQFMRKGDNLKVRHEILVHEVSRMSSKYEHKEEVYQKFTSLTLEAVTLMATLGKPQSKLAFLTSHPGMIKKIEPIFYSLNSVEEKVNLGRLLDVLVADIHETSKDRPWVKPEGMDSLEVTLEEAFWACVVFQLMLVDCSIEGSPKLREVYLQLKREDRVVTLQLFSLSNDTHDVTFLKQLAEALSEKLEIQIAGDEMMKIRFPTDHHSVRADREWITF